MMSALWSGVSGLNAHQIAMDVESHNIANVNTSGFKYGRVSFSDQISQTHKIATAPQNGMGGKNPMQVGLGVQADTTTRIFKQGNLQSTDRNLDLAIENDGFFITSPDGGNTYTYTRNGEFSMDANGNLINNQGYIIQGWTRDSKTGLIDASSPVGNIWIDPGMTTEAMPTTTISLKANLNSGHFVGESKKPISSLDGVHGAYGKGTQTPVDDEIHTENSTNDFIFDNDEKIIEQATDMSVLFNGKGDAINLREGQGVWISYTDAVWQSNAINSVGRQQVTFELNGTTITGTIGHNADPAQNVAQSTAAINTADLAKLINTYTKQTGVIANVTPNNELILTNDNRTGTMDSQRNIHIRQPGVPGAQPIDVVTAYKYQYVKKGSNAEAIQALDKNNLTSRAFTTTEDLRYMMQLDARKQGDVNGQDFDQDPGAGDTVLKVEVDDMGQFKFTKTNGDDTSRDLNIVITSYTNTDIGVNAVAANENFTNAMKAIDGKITQLNTTRVTQSFYNASLTATQDVYDSLGSKHRIMLEYIKVDSSVDNGTEWQVKVSVPRPGVINDTGEGLPNVIMGFVKFDKTGAIQSYSPSNISYSPNNGSAPNQAIKFNLGTIGSYDGLTSNDRASSVSNIASDGYASGDLRDVRVDETGTIIGEFSNGRSFGLAKVALATFANNEGLESKGGNMFIQTSNSGSPVIGAASSGGRGTIRASQLEMSNVDLSRALTQLIIVQRGYQANSKTITTSDQMLNTLLQLKQ